MGQCMHPHATRCCAAAVVDLWRRLAAGLQHCHTPLEVQGIGAPSGWQFCDGLLSAGAVGINLLCICYVCRTASGHCHALSCWHPHSFTHELKHFVVMQVSGACIVLQYCLFVTNPLGWHPGFQALYTTMSNRHAQPCKQHLGLPMAYALWLRHRSRARL